MEVLVAFILMNIFASIFLVLLFACSGDSKADKEREKKSYRLWEKDHPGKSLQDFRKERDKFWWQD